ncbi:DUF839 domain-containing protein [Streptomyces sp. S6]|nr:DUF839 domain-containing protein [Streptomyces sp. S6]
MAHWRRQGCSPWAPGGGRARAHRPARLPPRPHRPGGARRSLAQFTAVAASEADAVAVPAGFRADVLAPWGGPVHTTGPDWRADASATAADQAGQVGSHHHGVQFLPLDDGPEGEPRGLLVISHESTDPALLGGDARKAMAAQGLTVLEMREVKGIWEVVDSAYNRRITADSPVRFSGPVRRRDPRRAGRAGCWPRAARASPPGAPAWWPRRTPTPSSGPTTRSGGAVRRTYGTGCPPTATDTPGTGRTSASTWPPPRRAPSSSAGSWSWTPGTPRRPRSSGPRSAGSPTAAPP